MSLGEKIQSLRKKNGLSQEQLAERLNVSRQSVSKWELDQAVPDLEFVKQLSEIFNVSVDYLVKDNIETKTKIENSVSIQNKGKSYPLDNTVFTKFPFPLCIPAFIICSMFGFHNGWNWFGMGEPSKLLKIPVPFFITVIYLTLCFAGIVGWHPGWLVFLIIPIYYFFVSMTTKGK